MSGSISYNEVPSNWQVPGNRTEIRAAAATGLLPGYSRAVIVAPSGAATGLQRNVTAASAKQLFGVGTPASIMASLFLAANVATPLDVIGLPTNGGVQATGRVVVGAVPGVAGNSALIINGVRVPFSVSALDTVASVAASLAQAITSLYASAGLPVFAVASSTAAGTVGLTATCGGLWGNAIPVRLSPLPQDQLPGLTLTITAMANGTDPAGLDPVVSFDAIAASWYTDGIFAASDLQTQIEADGEAARRYGAMVHQPMRVWLCSAMSYGSALAQSASVNSRFVTNLLVYNPYVAPWAIAAVYGAVGALALATDPARQLRSLSLPGIMAPDDADVFTEPMRQQLLTNGWATWQRQQGGGMAIERAVTQYQNSAIGVPDTAWRDITTMSVLARVRSDWNSYVALTWPQAKLADDGSIAAQFADVVVTPSVMKGAWAARSKLYEQQGWLEGTAALAAQALFVRDGSNRNRLNGQMPVRVIGNLMDLDTVLSFSL